MIAEATDRALREFEEHTCSPATIQGAARLLEKLVGRGLDAGLIQEIQQLRLSQAIAYAAQHSPFYREMFERQHLTPADIESAEDLRKLPFTTGADLEHWQRFLCVSQDRLAAMFTTAGTTGEPKLVPYSHREMQRLTNLSAVAMRVAHPGRLVVLIALPMRRGLWMGWATAQRIVERAGGLPLPVGAGKPSETLRWMQRLRPNVLMSSPSYLAVLTREAEAQGYRPWLEKILVGGERLYEEQRARFADYWGAQLFDSYGTTEIGGGQTIVLPQCKDTFHLNDLHLFTEIIDPETGEPAEEGELIFSTLTREAAPLLRYRSGDRARRTTCDCWLPAQAIQLLGRLDDMFTAGDMGLYGRVLAEAVRDVPGTGGRVELVLDKADLTDRLRVRAEGSGADEAQIRQALFDAYPKMETNTENGNLVLEIESGADLGNQIKALRIRDLR